MVGQNSSVTFGPFSFDMELGRLTRNGRRISLPDKNAKLLAYLLEKRGGLAKRQEVLVHLWPDSVPHDAEQAINKAISQLRNALGDSSESPKYIETIPRRGYRFCAPVDFGAEVSNAGKETAVVQVATGTDASFMASAEATSRDGVEDDPGVPEADVRGGRSLDARGSWILVAAVVLLGLVLGGWRYIHARSLSRNAPITLGVASFSAEGADADSIAKGLRFDITDSLSELPNTKMLSAASTELLRADGTLKQTAGALGIDIVIFGDLALHGEDCEVRFELVKVTDGTHLATLHYTGHRDNLLAINLRFQNDVFSILRRVGANRALAGGTANAGAYEAYLQGLMLSNQFDADNAKLALADFQQAAALDPHYAAAYAMVAYEQMMLYHDGVGDGDLHLEQAEQAADEAIEIDPTLPGPHTVLGEVLFERWQTKAALGEYRLAVELSPNSMRAHSSLAWILARTPYKSEHVQEADAEIAKAHELAPYNAAIFLNESFIAYSFHDCTRAMQIVDKLNEVLKDNEATLRLNAQNLWACGHEQQAIATWRRLAEVQHFAFGVDLQDKGLAAWRSGGAKAYALVILSAIRAGKIPERFADPYDEALWEVVAGEDKEALALIKRRFAQHDWAFLSDAEAPELATLREDPELQSMLAQVYR